MDDAQIVERVKVEMFAADRGDASEEDVARAAIAAHKAALAEAGFVIVPYFPDEAMLRAGSIATEETYDNNMGKSWNVYRAMIVSAQDQR